MCEVSPSDDPDRVRITYENGSVSIVHVNLIRMSKVDTSDEVSKVEFAQFILRIKDDPSYRISFRGSIVDEVGPTEHSNVLWVRFSDDSGVQCRMLPAKALCVKNIALNSNSSVNNVNKASSSSAGAVVNNVNKSSSPVDDGIVTILVTALVLRFLRLRCLLLSCLNALPPLLLWASRNVERNYSKY